ncbi:MAG: hypothetical protein KAT68_12295 [Bacteroidales bacterium]|nr:hypothetical protein [Bacteroidales bacterium]
MKSKYNTLLTGLIFGFIIPVISFFIFYFFKKNNFDFTDFIQHLRNYNILSNLISLCVIPNLIIFFIFIWKNFLYSARGVVMATMIYGIIMIIIKFL